MRGALSQLALLLLLLFAVVVGCTASERTYRANTKASCGWGIQCHRSSEALFEWSIEEEAEAEAEGEADWERTEAANFSCGRVSGGGVMGAAEEEEEEEEVEEEEELRGELGATSAASA